MKYDALPPVLEDYRRQMATVTAETIALTDRLTPAELTARPGPESWSVLENIEHLRVTAALYAASFDRALADAPPAGEEWPGSYSWLWRLFVKSMEPPVKRRFRAPQPLHPAAVLQAEAVLAGFVEAQEAIVERIHRAAAVDPRKVKVVSPANARVKLPLACAFELLAAHARRHLWLARRAAGVRPE